ncbi:ZIP family metal transporter, partial [Candidatus Pacearchaeota archaeon CG10_big_fil_rev_8_21_14_0_10_35_13]
MVLINIIIAVVIVSAISLVGITYLMINKKLLEKIITLLVAFAAGTLIATAFYDLIPESYEALESMTWVIVGLLVFFLVESILHWHHHNEDCEEKDNLGSKKRIMPVVYLNLIGDAMHNFLDGIIIAAGFLAGTPTGIATTIAIAIHEIPQEIGDYAVLIKGGLSRMKALLSNFLTALTAIIGGVLGYYYLNKVQGLIPYIIAIAAGGFLYIATTDLLPELHRTKNFKKVIL